MIAQILYESDNASARNIRGGAAGIFPLFKTALLK
jgi:hypothetical protein